MRTILESLGYICVADSMGLNLYPPWRNWPQIYRIRWNNCHCAVQGHRIKVTV